MRHQRHGVVLDSAQTFTHLLGINLPGFGQRDTLLDAIKKADPEIVLERGNLSTDRTLRERQFFRRTSEALMARRRLESDQQLKPRDSSSHLLGSISEQYYNQ